ncbi:xanthine dehydrogenase family protein molybdopterin-binding subunit [Jiulongibacter sediminis]|uniref:Isoquinoline 1-oxidoreductase n=1 Tax=Jiulongibacter sediminis TaxID=1605367 RepID=A0A0P7C4Z1_9BACT|nr:molybdopterin cofactor-binding domain-containing protein [Jiulongibacter sediminis]KPM49777.1 isoquinoline 1-oxidoreductase [Jiulongibacter sediminis]TBX26815.1 isoquinoline 1-oxidoreductase [Jiulongibacter sediminis]
MKTKKKSLDRRSFLKSSALAGGGLMLTFNWFTQAKAAEAMGESLAETWHELTGYIKITPDNVIKILNPNPEFGQNVMTSLPMMVAEELEVDFEKVVVEMGPHDNAKLGPQFTGGSNSVRMYYNILRQAGATARQMLTEAAAQTWGVSADQVIASNGMLTSGNRKATYGEMASKAASMTAPKDVQLKSPSEFKVIRTAQKNVEGKKVVTGKPLFGLDYQAEGMKIAMILHPPAFGMTLKSFDASQALRMPGIKDVFSFKLFDEDFAMAGFDVRTFNEQIAIVGDSTWQVMNARKKIRAEWTERGDARETRMGRGGSQTVTIPGKLESTNYHFDEMEEGRKTAKVQRRDGDPETAFKNAAVVIEKTYNAPFLAHNCMEPMNGFADVREDSAIIAGPHQAPGWIEPTLSKVLGIAPDKIEMISTRMGGGFGRRAYGQYYVEAALISKQAKVPVKLVYSREDDMSYGIYRPMYTATYRAALDENKNLIAFHVSGGGIPESPIHANRFPAGALDNYLAESWEVPSNITIGAFRAPRSNFNAAAEQSFLDEVAEAMGKDPIQMRLDLLKRAKENPVGSNNDYDADRYAGVLELVREKSGWGKPENNGKRRGVAAYFCHNSYAAHVVDMIERDGEPYVEQVTSALDCGIVINPEGAANMVQGAVTDGIGQSFYGTMTFNNGVTDHKNFDTYRMIRHNESPKKIDVHFVENDIAPTGLGEPPFPPVFGAVANALYKTTGKRYYNQPFMNAEQPESI